MKGILLMLGFGGILFGFMSLFLNDMTIIALIVPTIFSFIVGIGGIIGFCLSERDNNV